MRQQGYFSLYEAEYVILETNGEVSVAPKHEFGPPTKNDLNIPYSQTNLPIALIMDGKVVPGNLKEANVDEKWLKTAGNQENKGIQRSFYAEWQQERGLEITKF